jgi:hypothetical protein
VVHITAYRGWARYGFFGRAMHPRADLYPARRNQRQNLALPDLRGKGVGANVNSRGLIVDAVGMLRSATMLRFMGAIRVLGSTPWFWH